MSRIQYNLILFSLIGIVFFLGTSNKVFAAVEQRCNELGANCVCSEPLQTTVFNQINTYFWDAADTTAADKQCHTIVSAPGYEGTLISSGSRIWNSLNSGPAWNALPPSHSLKFIQLNNEGPTGSFSLQHSWATDPIPTARRAQRLYLYYTPNFVFSEDYNNNVLPGVDCQNSGKTIQLSERGGGILTFNSDRWVVHAWAYLYDGVRSFWGGGPTDQPQLGATGQGLTMVSADFKGKWWRYEVVYRNLPGPKTIVEVYLKNVTDNTPEFKILDTSLPRVYTDRWGNQTVWTQSQADNLSLDQGGWDMFWDLFRNPQPGRDNCAGAYGFTEFAAAAWNTDAGQRIGAACEVEGGCGAATPTPDTSAPSTPTNLTATAISTTQINLSWTASTDNVGVSGYRIYRNGTQIATTATNSYSNTALSPATAYAYTVAAYDLAGNVSSQSSSVSATTQSPSPSPTPSTITMGETTILSSNNSGDGGLLIAHQVSLAQTATLQSLSFYVDTAAGNLRLGVYDATGPGGGPGTKKAETNAFTPLVGWNTQNVITPISLPAGTYWLAYLPTSSSLVFRSDFSSGPARYYPYTFGPLPTTYSTSPTPIVARWSFYATLNTATATPVPDTTSPSISLTAPAANATVSSSLTVSASASDNVGVSGVQFKLDGSNLGVEDTTAPYSITWNTTATANGSHTLTAAARDAAGNQTTSTGVSVTVSNTVADTAAPTTPSGLTATALSTTQINLSWTASTDNVGVSGYRIYRSGTQIATTATNSYSNTSLTPSTAYSYTIAAYDAAGNTSVQSAGASATTQSASVTTTTTTTNTSPTNTTTSTNTSTANTSTNTTSPAGGSSGGVGSSVTTPATSSTYTPSSSQTTSTTPVTPSLSLTRTLYQGAKGTDVKNLQTFLISSGYLAPSNTTGFYGPLTTQAVQKYQCAQNIVCSGTQTSTGYGMVGLKTRAKLNGSSSSYVSTSTLTPAQADSIIALIQSFGADAAVIARVKVVLGR